LVTVASLGGAYAQAEVNADQQSTRSLRSETALAIETPKTSMAETLRAPQNAIPRAGAMAQKSGTPKQAVAAPEATREAVGAAISMESPLRP
jgi:hypothetical protein